MYSCVFSLKLFCKQRILRKADQLLNQTATLIIDRLIQQPIIDTVDRCLRKELDKSHWSYGCDYLDLTLTFIQMT